MPAEFFLDTNVFVYTFDSSAPAKRARARELGRGALETGDGVTSWQVALGHVTELCSRPKDLEDLRVLRRLRGDSD